MYIIIFAFSFKELVIGCIIMNNIVVSRYNKNVDFVYKIKDINVMIYDKENNANPLNIPVNKGQEASVYYRLL